MKIISYKFQEKEKDGWEFSELRLKNVNLFVGKSGCGKTRVLNTIFNIGSFVAVSNRCLGGEWKFELDCDGKFYTWDYRGDPDPTDDSKNIISSERIVVKDDKGKDIVLVERDKKSFCFKGNETPKLSSESSAIHILKEEADIEPLFKGFCGIMRRLFFADELREAVQFAPVPRSLGEELKKNKSLETLRRSDQKLNAKLYLLDKYFPELLKTIFAAFQNVFPTIESYEITDLTKAPNIRLQVELISGFAPVFTVREKGVKRPLLLSDISSGMLKVLLILVDVMTLPGGNIYILDEYENSLGINAINFLPSLLIDYAANHQFLITSHHPYLINAIPVDNWFVFHRSGSKIDFQYGEELVKKFGKSSQKAFIQLLNDPFYSEGRK